jgi:hypothetical protein
VAEERVRTDDDTAATDTFTPRFNSRALAYVELLSVDVTADDQSSASA